MLVCASSKIDYLVSIKIPTDIALFKRPGLNYSWIEEGIKLLQNDSNINHISPASGPREKSESTGILSQTHSYKKNNLEDMAEVRKRETMTTRYYLVPRENWQKMKKMPYTPDEQLQVLWWKHMVARQQNKVDLPSGDANGEDGVWALHLGNLDEANSAKVLHCLDVKGRYPSSQVGIHNWVVEWLYFDCP